MNPNISYQNKLISTATLATIFATLGFLLLHIIEPEYGPMWRFVSEYSNGHYGFIMRITFLLFATATLTTALLLKSLKPSRLGKIALTSFFVSTVGLILAACFNQDPITSKVMTFAGNMHGFATILGIPGFSIGALFTAFWFNKQESAGNGRVTNIIVGVLPLVSFLLMLGYLFTAISPETGFTPDTYTGLLNRVFIVAMIGWLFYFISKVKIIIGSK